MRSASATSRCWCSTSSTRWCPSEITGFCAGKRAVLVIEEGQPEFIEQEIATTAAPARPADAAARQGPAADGRRVHGRGAAAAASLQFAAALPAEHPVGRRARAGSPAPRRGATPTPRSSRAPLPARPPSFCIGCPERPVFAALKLAQRELGPMHISADIGCHAFATFEPFSFGNSILGYGMSLASGAGVSPMMQRRTLAIMGDGGFWHNGLLSGVQTRSSTATTRAADLQERLHVGHRHAGNDLHARRRRKRAAADKQRAPGRHRTTTIETR